MSANGSNGQIISDMGRKSTFRGHIDSNIDKLLLQMKEGKDKEKMLCTLSGKNEYRGQIGSKTIKS